MTARILTNPKARFHVEWHEICYIMAFIHQFTAYRNRRAVNTFLMEQKVQAPAVSTKAVRLCTGEWLL
jgi:hypothetical protein